MYGSTRYSFIEQNPQVILRKRRYGGVAIKHLDEAHNIRTVEIIRRPPEEEAYKKYMLQQQANRYGQVQDITTGAPLEPPEKKTYKKVITDNMKGSDIVEVEADRQNLAVTYVDKDGNVTIKQGGNKAWRTNNPGNLSFSSLEKAKEAGAIGVWEDAQGHKFGIFPSEEAGTKALKSKLKERRFSYRKDGSKRDIAHMIEEIYAPSSDNNDSRGYANFLRDRYGVDVYNKTVEDLDDDEMDRLVQGIAAREGNKAGNLITKKK